MPIPAEILAVERPRNTRVKKSGDRYLVIKRTCKRVDGRNIPVELGTIGEIIDGKYVAKRDEPKPKGIDILDFGETELCRSCAGDLLQDLAKVWDLQDAKRIYVIALVFYLFISNNQRHCHYHRHRFSAMICRFPILHPAKFFNSESRQRVVHTILFANFANLSGF